MTSNERPRKERAALPLLGRLVPSQWLARGMPSPGRFPILDDALLGSAWRWDADDDRGVPTH